MHSGLVWNSSDFFYVSDIVLNIHYMALYTICRENYIIIIYYLFWLVKYIK